MGDLYFRTKYDYYKKEDIIDFIKELLVKNKYISFDKLVEELKKQYKVKYINKKPLFNLVKENFKVEQKIIQELPQNIFFENTDSTRILFHDVLFARFDEDINLILSSFNIDLLKQAYNDSKIFDSLYPLFKKQYLSLKKFNNTSQFFNKDNIKNLNFSLKFFISKDFYEFLQTKNCLTMNDLLKNISNIEFYKYYDEIEKVITYFTIDFASYLKEFDNLFTYNQHFVATNRFYHVSYKEIAKKLNLSESRVKKIEKTSLEKYNIFSLKNDNLFIKIIKSLVVDYKKTSIKELKNYLTHPETFINLENKESVIELDLINLSDVNLYHLNLPSIFYLDKIKVNLDKNLFLEILKLDYNIIDNLIVKKNISNIEKIKFANEFEGDINTNYENIFKEKINQKSLNYFINKIKNNL